MGSRSDERSPLQYCVIDVRTNRPAAPWARLWKTANFAMTFKELEAKNPRLAIFARVPPDYSKAGPGVAHLTEPEHVWPEQMLDRDSRYFWEVRFPRRTGLRGFPSRYPRPS